MSWHQVFFRQYLGLQGYKVARLGADGLYKWIRVSQETIKKTLKCKQN